MESWDNEKKVLLIQYVRDRELLWKPSDILYSKRDFKEEAWTTLAELMETNKKEVKAQWRSLRVNYMAERRKMKGKSGTGTDEVTSKWMFFKEMDFLSQTLKKSTSRSNFAYDDNENTESQADLNEEVDWEFTLPDIENNTQEDPGLVLVTAESPSEPSVQSSSRNMGAIPSTSLATPVHNRQTKSQRQKRKREDDEATSNIELMNAVTESLKKKQSDSPDDRFLLVVKDYFTRIPEGREKDEFKLSILRQIMEHANSV